MSRPLSLALYGLATAALEPLAPAILARRARRGKEDTARIAERLGHASLPRPDGDLVWLHGVSVGESLSLLPLIDRIRAERPSLAILVTSGTVTSATLLARRLPAGVIHQFAPVDGPRAVARFLDHWRPGAAIFAESELWPNLILEAQARGVKLALVSARITEHTARGWAARPGAARALLSAFDLILPQDRASAERLSALGAEVGPALNLKYVGTPPPADPAQVKALKAAAAGRKVVLAASTHAGEEEFIAAAQPPGALLIVAPRHPERGEAVEALFRDRGRKTARRSRGETPTAKTEVYIADTLGEMGLLLRLADVAVIGGSFLPGIGGHNPLEPARLEVAAISGPEVFNFADVYAEMAQAGAVTLSSADELSTALSALLADPAAAKAQAAAAKAYADRQTGALEAGWALIRNILP